MKVTDNVMYDYCNLRTSVIDPAAFMSILKDVFTVIASCGLRDAMFGRIVSISLSLLQWSRVESAHDALYTILCIIHTALYRVVQKETNKFFLRQILIQFKKFLLTHLVIEDTSKYFSNTLLHYLVKYHCLFLNNNNIYEVV